MSTRDLTVTDQHAFVRAALAGARRVLEVGAGRGALARRLQEDGFVVTAIDLSLPEMEEASGVRYVEADFLDFEALPFDAVVFTSSLHHISPLGPALDRARELVVPGGLLVLDEFDLEAPDLPTLSWYYELMDRLALTGVYEVHGGHPHPHHGGHDHGHERPPALGPIERWRVDHEHTHGPPLHGGEAMLREVCARFVQPKVTRGPYLHRHLWGGLHDVKIAREVRAEEERGIGSGLLRPVGLRVIAGR